MPQSLSSILIHLVFSTKIRVKIITPEIEIELYPYLAAVFRQCKSPSLLVGGATDHIHALFSLHRTWTAADVVEEVKNARQNGLKQKARNLKVSRGKPVTACFPSGGQTFRR